MLEDVVVQVPDALPAAGDQLSTAEDTETESSVSSVEIKVDNALAVEMQLTAQSIVFSFLQKKDNKDKMISSLVPAISITLQNYQLMCYDSEEDILMSTIADSEDTELFDDTKKSLKYTSVVVLWMALNYRHLCSGVPTHSEKIRWPDIKAGFFDRVGDKLYLYEKEVQRPAHVSPKKMLDVPKSQGTSMLQILGDHTIDMDFQPLF